MRELFERAIMLEHPQARAHARANDIARTLGAGAQDRSRVSTGVCVRARAEGKNT